MDKSGKKGIMSGDVFDQVREAFSVNNDAAKFMRYRSRYVPNRRYIITPTGKFEIGMFFDIKKYIMSEYPSTNIHVTDDFKAVVTPRYNITQLEDLNYTLRDYQSTIVRTCLRLVVDRM